MNSFVNARDPRANLIRMGVLVCCWLEEYARTGGKKVPAKDITVALGFKENVQVHDILRRAGFECPLGHFLVLRVSHGRNQSAVDLRRLRRGGGRPGFGEYRTGIPLTLMQRYREQVKVAAEHGRIEFDIQELRQQLRDAESGDRGSMANMLDSGLTLQLLASRPLGLPSLYNCAARYWEQLSKPKGLALPGCLQQPEEKVRASSAVAAREARS